MRAENKQARRTTAILITPEDGDTYIELKSEIRSADEAAKVIDLLRALCENAWNQTITFGEDD